MRLALVADVHANLEALRAALADIAASGVDRVVCLGDVVGYNADPAGCIAALRRVGAVCVAGNHDRAVAGLLAPEGFGAEAARALAVRAMQEGGSSTTDRIRFAFRLATSRNADDVELQILSDLYDDCLKETSSRPADAEKLLAVGLAGLPDGVNREEAVAWTMVSRAILNLGETYNRN